MKIKWSFILASLLTSAAAILHIAIIVGGPDWYRASGAGNELALMAESGSAYPAFLGSVLTLIFLGWAIYALSGAGIIIRLPLLKTALILITIVCVVRGLYGFFVPVFIKTEYVASLGVEFWVFSSIVWLSIGLSYLHGVINNWSYLKSKNT